MTEQDPPPGPLNASVCKLWWKLIQYPSVFVLCNVLYWKFVVDKARVLSKAFDNEYDFTNIDEDESTGSELIPAMEYISMTMLLVVDAILLYRAFRFVEKQVTAVDSFQDDAERKEFVYGYFSREADYLLGSSSKMSVFVSCLLLLSFLCASYSFGSLFVYSYLSSKTMDQCFKLSNLSSIYYPSSSSSKAKIPGIPDALQDGDNFYMTFQGFVARLTDGTTYFSAPAPRSADYSVLATSFTNGTLHYWEDISSPSSYTNVTGDSLLESELFCGGFTSRKHETQQAPGVFCVHVQSSPRTTVIDLEMVQPALLRVYEGTLWIFVRQGDTDMYFTLNPSTMKLRSVANYTEEEPPERGTHDILRSNGWTETYAACYHRSYRGASLIVAVALTLSGIWILKKDGGAVGAGCIWLATYVAFLAMPRNLRYFLAHDWIELYSLPYWVVMITIAASVLCLCTGWVPAMLQRECLVWCSVLALVEASDATRHYHTPEVTACQYSSYVALCLVLGYPTFEVDGVMSFFFHMSNVFYHLLGWSDFVGAFNIVLYDSVLLVGTVTFGFFMRSYRAYLRYHVFRFWRTQIASRFQRCYKRAFMGNGAEDNSVVPLIENQVP